MSGPTPDAADAPGAESTTESDTSSMPRMPSPRKGPRPVDDETDDRTLRAALDAYRHGFVPIPLRSQEKAPNIAGWQNMTYADEGAVEAGFAGRDCNIGVLLGEPSSRLVNIDPDSPVARRVARDLLPTTPAWSGKDGTHAWYLIDERDDLPSTKKLTDADRRSVIEVRSTGAQTVIPPSVDGETGEVYSWDGGQPWGGDDGPATVRVSDLQASVHAVALVEHLAEVWPQPGSRHDAFLALAGALLRGGHDDERLVHLTRRTIKALARATGDDEAGVRAGESVDSTIRKLAAEENARGWTTLAVGSDGNLPLLVQDAATVGNARAALDGLRSALGVGAVDVEIVSKAEESEFWDSRPLLVAVRDFARARRVGPWAMLGAVLARAVASVPPSVVLPPTKGSVASLNSFVAVCGESGSGKSAAADAAREFLIVRRGSDFLEASPGSGEGLIAAYTYTRKEKGKAPEVIQHRTSVLLTVDEIAGLGALANRTASTLISNLKSGWVGKELSNLNAEVERRRQVEAHAYRLAVVAGVQPAHAGVILDDADGGFPQRWLWMPTFDPGMLGHGAPTDANTWKWTVPVPPVQEEVEEDGSVTLHIPPRVVLSLPDVATDAVHEFGVRANRPIGSRLPAGEELDGHALLTRCKVAAILALLDGRADDVTEEDWGLAGVVMRVSDRTRAEVIAVRGRTVADQNEARGRAEGRRQVVAQDEWDKAATATASQRIRTVLAAASGSDGLSGADLKRKVGQKHRQFFDEAVEALIATGDVSSVEVEYRGQKGVRYFAGGHGG